MSDRFGSSVRLREERSSRVELFVRDLNAIGGDGVRSPGRTESERDGGRGKVGDRRGEGLAVLISDQCRERNTIRHDVT